MTKTPAGRGAGREGSRGTETGEGPVRHAGEAVPGGATSDGGELRLGAALRQFAHDLKNQLTIVIGSAELAAARVDADERLAKQLEQIRIAADRALALIAELVEGDRPDPPRP